MTILSKNEVDIIEQNIIFHKIMGVDAFIVTDNISTDGTREVFQKYKDKGWILEIIDEESQVYDQDLWVSRMVHIAKEKYNADWVINADSDEFWYSEKHNLKWEIENSHANVIQCPIYNMIPPKSGVFYNSVLKVVKKLENLEKYNLSKFNILGTSIPKVMHSTQGFIKTHMGNHGVDIKFPYKKEATDITIFHFPIRSKEHFINKMLTGGKAYSHNTRLDKSVGCHWRYFYDGHLNGSLNLEKEYEKFMAYDYLAKLEEKKYIIYDATLKDFIFYHMNLQEKFNEVKNIFPKVFSTQETLRHIIENNPRPHWYKHNN